MDKKTFEFHGTPGQYFVVFLITLVCTYIPLFGWAYSFNYTNNWIADNLTVNGRKVKYTAGYMETLKFLFINLLLLIVTLGIYIFWFVPKQYRYTVGHASFADETPSPVPTEPAKPSEPVAPSNEPTPPTEPSSPVPPTTPTA